MLRKILSLLDPSERRTAAVLLVLMVVGMVLETLGIGLIIPAIALLTQNDLGARYPALQPWLARLGNPSQARLVFWGMLTLVGVNVVRAAFMAFMARQQTRFAFGVQAHLSARLFRTYLRQPYAFLLQRNSAELIRNTITEVSQFNGNAVQPLLLILTEAMVLAGLAALLMVVEPLGALTVVAVMGAAAFSFHLATRRAVARWGLRRQEHEGQRIQHLQQGLGGSKDVKLLGREEDFLASYDRHNIAAARVGGQQITLAQLPRLWLELLAVSGLTILVLTMLAQGRDVSLIVPSLGLFAAGAFRLMPSVNRVVGAMQSLRFAGPVIDTLHSELQLPVPPPAPRGRALTFSRVIEVSHVTFVYDGAAGPALDDVSISVAQGESIGVIGPSGSGKSTLIDVMLGLLSPTSGGVIVDGVDIRTNARGWQDRIGYVPQTIYLTDDTLRRNVAFGVPDAEIDDAAVARAIAAAQLGAFVEELPEKLLTMVGERGVRLSGGQRQRIGMARALYHDPAVLVLDEATSALDTVTERGVMEAVAALQGRKTIIIVAHRLSTVEHCDRIYRLERGQVAAEGPTAAMLQTTPPYVQQ